MDGELDKAKIVVVALTFLGVLVFAVSLGYVLLSPAGLERRAQAFVIAEIEEALGQRLPMPASPWKKDLPETLSNELAEREQAILKSLGDFVVAAVAAMCRLDCDSRARLEAAMQKIYDEQLDELKLGADKLRDVVAGRYDAVFVELRRDLVVFLTCNLVAMALAFLLALLRRGAAGHLLPIAVILSASTLIACYWYVFGQNWILTIIYADFAGWTYLAGLGFLFLLLVDIGLNRARVTSEMFNAIADMIGYDRSWSPC